MAGSPARPAASRPHRFEQEIDPGPVQVLVTKIDSGRAEKLAALGASRVVLAMPPTAYIDEARDMLSACVDRLALAR